MNFTGNFDGVENTAVFFFLKEAKETILDFSQGTARVLLRWSINLKCQCKIILFTTRKIEISNKKRNQDNSKIIINMIGNSKDKGNFPHKLLLTVRQDVLGH